MNTDSLLLLKNMLFMRGSLGRTADEIQRLQEKRLRKLLHFSFRNSEYYHGLFTASGFSEKSLDSMPLAEIPVLDKKTLLENFEAVATVKNVSQQEMRDFDGKAENSGKLYKGKYHIVHSSGSTGKPGYFLYDRNAWSTMLAGIVRAALWKMGSMEILRFLSGRPRILYIAATDGRYGGAMAVGDGISGTGCRELFLDVRMPLSEWKEKLLRFSPDMIIGYPTAVRILAGLSESGELSLHPFRIVTCGEPLGKNLRSYFESLFGCTVINFYGASESLALGADCGDGNGMILFDDMNIIEADRDGILVTSLYNYAQPLIRYRISDSLELLPPAENGGIPFSRAKAVAGRCEELLWFKDSGGNREFIHPLAVEGFCLEGLVDYQFRKYGETSLELTARLASSVDGRRACMIRNELTALMGKILEEKRLGAVRFSVRFADEILPDPVTGKKPLIITA